MPSVAAPYGLKPVGNLGGNYFNGATRKIPMTANSATAIYRGDLVAIVAGAPVPATGSPTTSIGANSPVGVMAGCSFVDPVAKTQVWSSYLPASAVTNGYTGIELYVYDDPNMLFQVQSDGATARANVGSNAPLGNFGGSATTGNSTINLTHGSIATTATLAVRIVDIVDAGAAYPDVIVKWNTGVHAYVNTTGQ